MMNRHRKVQVGLVGSQFVSTLHAEALRRCPDAEVLAVASPTPGHAQQFAARYEIPHWFTDHRRMLETQALRQAVQDALGNDHILSEGAVAPVLVAGHSKDLTAFAEVRPTSSAIPASAAVNGRIEGHPIAWGPGADFFPHPGDEARGFVSHHERRDPSPGASIHPMNIAATDAAGLHFDENLIRTRHGLGHLFVFEPVVGCKNKSLHDLRLFTP